MPPNHTTRASLLLKWPSINYIVRDVLAQERIFHIEAYPMLQEQARGSLRLFGRGEGPDLDIRASEKGTPRDFAMTDGEDGWVQPPVSSPGAWGQVGGLALGPGIDNKGGVLTVDGNPDWDPVKVWRYVQSFKDNMLNMHPIIIPRELDAMVRVFLDELPKTASVSSTRTTNSSAGFINSSGSTVTPEPGHNKRKRSPGGEEQSPVTFFRKPGRPFRNVQNTLVLLVLALGKICLHRTQIPDVIHELDDFDRSPSMRNGVSSSPGQGSPAGYFPHSQSSGLPSPRENERVAMMSRRSSLQGSVKQHRLASTYKRNIDVIPGLEYFALASDMMGGDYGGFGLKHVHVHILAGLYHGQLGRVLESWEHIATASRKLQVELAPSLDRLSKMKFCEAESRRDNQLAFAFWTCLQLESDILAELQLPQSGILAYEGQMPYPNSTFSTANDIDRNVAEGYLAQLYLRKKLNMVHGSLYDPSKAEGTERQHYEAMVKQLEHIQANIKYAKNLWVPQIYSWSDEDTTLPTDFLTARLRAKYWGSQVILHRPFLRMILNDDLRIPDMYPNSQAIHNLDIPAIDPQELYKRRHNPLTMHYAELAIRALIQSTCAFHGLDGSKRLIITNVFGTAHAQWGNLVTLTACYKHPLLRHFISPTRLRDLFTRTIAFLRMNAPPSSSLHSDMNILIALQRDLGMADEIEVKVDDSFSAIS